MNAAFLATSEHHVLSLDEDGVCRVITPCGKPGGGDVSRCLGAQFVATLDPVVSGLLAVEPRPGVSMLFIRVEDGRASLLRFGPIVAFESLSEAEVGPESAVRELPVQPRMRKASGVVIRKRAAAGASTPPAPRAYRAVKRPPVKR